MAKFFKVAVLFICSNLLLSVCLVACYFCYYGLTLNDIPPPPLSDSYSLNEKMEFLRKSAKSAKIIAIGSSMSLINLHSKTITDELHCDSFLNTSSWGMTMKDNFHLLKILSDIYTPTTLIIVGNIGDFTEKKKHINYPILKNYIYSDGIKLVFYYLKYFNLSYYSRNFRYAKRVRSCTDEYEYLGFDKYGTVNYDGINFKISLQRWNSDPINAEVESSQYSYLDGISTFCKQNNIKILFFQSPIRKGLRSMYDQKKTYKLRSHTDKIENILKRDNHIFIDANNVMWEDRLFADGTHLNKVGAKRFTEYCFNEIKSNARHSVSSLAPQNPMQKNDTQPLQ
jgi:hypothetical protein